MLRLSDAGVPLVNEKGSGNENIWCLLNNTPSIPNIPLTLREQIASSFLKQSIQLLKGTRLENDLKGVFHKLEQLISPSVVDILDYVPSDFAFDTFMPGIYDYSNHGHIIDELIRAIRERKKCKIMYSSLRMNEPGQRTIYPQRILIYGGGLYTVSHSTSQSKWFVYAIQRIDQIDVLDRQFKPSTKFTIADFRESRYGIFEEPPVSVVLHFSPDGAKHIENRLWHPTQKSKKLRNGNLKIKLRVGISYELVGWIMSWGKYVKMIKPVSLKNLIISNFKESILQYKK